MITQIQSFYTRRSDFRTLFETLEGRRVLVYLSRIYGIFRPTFREGDPSGSAYAEGQRSVILHIYRLLREDPDKFVKRIQEGDEKWQNPY